jgi:hypothetical protein
MKAPLSGRQPRALVDASDADSLIQGELEAAAFPDERLGKRLGVMLDQFADGTVIEQLVLTHLRADKMITSGMFRTFREGWHWAG